LFLFSFLFTTSNPHQRNDFEHKFRTGAAAKASTDEAEADALLKRAHQREAEKKAQEEAERKAAAAAAAGAKAEADHLARQQAEEEVRGLYVYVCVLAEVDGVFSGGFPHFLLLPKLTRPHQAAAHAERERQKAERDRKAREVLQQVLHSFSLSFFLLFFLSFSGSLGGLT
jgi:hypothetical protein